MASKSDSDFRSQQFNAHYDRHGIWQFKDQHFNKFDPNYMCCSNIRGRDL